MFRSLVSAAVLFAGVALSSPAAAQTFDPKPANYTFSGSVQMSGGSLVVTCTVTIDFSVDALGVETVTNRTVTGGLFCGSPIAPYGAWTIDAGPGLTAVGLNMGFTPGGPACYGPVATTFAAGTMSSTITFTPTFLPPAGGGPGCTVRGSLTSTSAVNIVP